MKEFGSGYNLPPGVYEHHLPGNRPQDIEAERYVENLDEEDLVGYIEENVVGTRIVEQDRGWLLDDEVAFTGSTAQHDAVSYFLAAEWEWIEEQMVEAHLDDPYEEEF